MAGRAVAPGRCGSATTRRSARKSPAGQRFPAPLPSPDFSILQQWIIRPDGTGVRKRLTPIKGSVTHTNVP
jgi:hypothetical protein